MSDSEKPTLLVVDGHSLAFRAFYALPVDSFVNREGQHTNAIHGFIAMFINLLQQQKPTHIAVAFDISRYSFRTREYPEYKGTRGETPSEFAGQVPLLEEALHAMNVTTIAKEDYEADDILATLARRGVEEGYKVLLVSGDRDTIQLVNDDVTLLYPNVRGVSELKVYDPAAVREKYGIEPHQYPEIAALVGETSDNLIGIDKVGEKTAVKWVQQYGTVENIVAHADEIKGVVGQNLRDQKENALRNRRLNQLLDDVELPIALDDLERKPLNENAVRDIFARLQFKTLLDRLMKTAAEDGMLDGAMSVAEVGDAGAVSAPAVRTLVDEELANWLSKASADDTAVAVQLEVGPAGITGFGLAAADDTVYVPWVAGRKDYEALEQWLASSAPKYFFHAKPQFKALSRAGFVVDGLAFDTRIASWLVKPGAAPQSLAEQVYEVLGETLPVSDPNQLVPINDAVSPATEAWYIRRVAEGQMIALDEGTRAVLDDIELPLVAVLAEMELNGVSMDSEVLARLRGQLTDKANDYAAQAYAQIGHEINLGSPKQLQQVLFEELGMPKTRATKTGYSTDAGSLADLQEKNPHPFLGLLLQHRDATKLKQIVETLERSVEVDGRIHTTYDQTGTSTGRISSNDPNLQNIPIRTEEGREIRSAFRHGEGFETLLTADYSQIEMRIMAHLSEDPGLIEAFNAGEDLHRFVGARVFGVDPSEVTSAMRTKVKAMSYGLAYGLSAFGLSKQLRIETSEARQLMTDYFERFGAVRDYLRNVVEQARVDGFTETIFGRRRPFADLTSTNRVLRENAERQALNAPIQGSAADIMKVAMLGIAGDIIDQSLESRMLLQVHDELIFEVAPGEWDALEAIVRARMAGAAGLRVPLDVQVGRGSNWDAAAH
ncbi:DNA polymerase I [Leifsonia sp. 98AMF]|uniref:DNA polymerase I n=1 Tax=unclassified Leifsonia TaxID=2663824 RepID=UPI00087A9376|nr:MULTISPECIES: DNA polymerase I [unclassified Leifsonia]SDH38337.1 DNA polymerase I [Leifsonia sp. 197AMF]SDI97728.1 DNA polymerase I [Leifsonia sp. 466MF]SDJ77341.1 DNA polymerase I [Leifsonia sp. 157MF]SDO01110.1 DNA polymerase I [Leifsonia sp. 509MF]SEN02949.1 DNA polymerase I [Leifsonia sp. 467MF]